MYQQHNIINLLYRQVLKSLRFLKHAFLPMGEAFRETMIDPELRSCSQLSGLAQSVTIEGPVDERMPCLSMCKFLYTYLPLTVSYVLVFLKVMIGYCM